MTDTNPFMAFDTSNPPSPGTYWALVQRPNNGHAGYATRRVLIELSEADGAIEQYAAAFHDSIL
ncbi:MAG: hypothetical protein AWU57_173 [Marinobacter sp. T13-3]|nr:MAG: hypothetical protein AWU57_173 [Marinobacter sp. T13-3]